MTKPKPHNLTLDPDLTATFNACILPKMRVRSLSEWLNNALLKETRARLSELRKALPDATSEQRETIKRAIETAISK